MKSKSQIGQEIRNVRKVNERLARASRLVEGKRWNMGKRKRRLKHHLLHAVYFAWVHNIKIVSFSSSTNEFARFVEPGYE